MNETTFQPLDAELPDTEAAQDQLYITEEICDHWQETSRWTYYIAIAGYSALVLIVLGIFYVSSLLSIISSEMLLAALVCCSIIFILSRCLGSYSKTINTAAIYSDWEAMELAFSSLHRAYAVYGFFLLCIVLLLGYLFGALAVKSLPLLLQSY